MSRFRSYLNTSVKIIEAYKGNIPLAQFLSGFFSENKKYGSRDRRSISSLCYFFFRLGKAASSLTIYDRIVLGFFLCEKEPSDFLENIKPEWNDKAALPIQKKIGLVKQQFSVTDIFPLKEELSAGIDHSNFSQSFLVQPDLFLRIRDRVRQGVLKKLERSKLDYKLMDDDCISLPNSTNVEDFFITDKEVVVQDYNSQKVLDYFKPQNATFKTPLTASWDCCAASGGKSILLFDIFNQRIELTISDIRANIILNLHKRFAKAGIKTYNYFITDLGSDQFVTSLPQEQRLNLKPKIIICDVPCTGSGTWSRTPEQLAFFDPASIKIYSEKQKKIVSNVIPYLQKDGILVYITCSVFKKENEAIADFIHNEFNLELVQSNLLRGYDKKADTMFVAIFRKN